MDLQIVIDLNTDNEEFNSEVNSGGINEHAAKYVKLVAKAIESGYTSKKIMDGNGNTIGKFEVTNITSFGKMIGKNL